MSTLTEECSCGATFTFSDSWVHKVRKAADQWRQNHIHAESADALAQAWQDNYDGMFQRWAECDAERRALKEQLADAEMRLRLLATDTTRPAGDDPREDEA